MDKCLAFCQTLAMSNHKFTFSLSLGKDNFNFSNKELVESSWKMKKKSPSQKRREEKRKIERTRKKVAERVTDGDVIKPSEKVSKEVSEKETETEPHSVRLSCQDCDHTSKTTELMKEHVKDNHTIEQLDGSSEQKKATIKCDQCRFEATSKNMMKYHTRLKHRTHHCEPGFEEYVFLPNNICPLCPVESGYCKCGSCDECKDFVTEHGFNIHMMNDHSPNDCLIHFGPNWIKEHKQYIHRNIKYAEDRQHSKEWDTFIAEEHLE